MPKLWTPEDRTIALDTETTGLDFKHGAKPYFVTTCDEDGNQRYWEWDVDPLTREVLIPKVDKQEIVDLIFGPIGDDGPNIVMQNGKFDVAALGTILGDFSWPWHKTDDTLFAGHLLASNRSHNLTDMAMEYLGADIQRYEDALEEACKKARRECRLKSFIAEYGKWAIAEEGRADMPSCRKSSNNKLDKGWKFDSWLPRAFCKFFSFPEDHPWWTIARDYANVDSAVTLALWKVQKEQIIKRGLWEIYQVSNKRSRIAYLMEKNMVTLSAERRTRLVDEFETQLEQDSEACLKIAESYGYELDLPKGAAVNDSLRIFCFDVMKLPHVTNPKAKTDAPTLDAKNAMPFYMATLPEGKPREFLTTLLKKRVRDKALGDMRSYARWDCGKTSGV